MKPTRHLADIHVGKRIRELREIRSVTQGWLAGQIGISFQQLQKYETAANRVSSSKLFGIGSALGVPPSYFLEGFGDEVARDDVAKDKGELELLISYRAIPKRVKKSVRLTVAAIADGQAND